jgi:hypothetical protein
MGQKRGGHGKKIQLFVEMILKGGNQTRRKEKNSQGKGHETQTQKTDALPQFKEKKDQFVVALHRIVGKDVGYTCYFQVELPLGYILPQRASVLCNKPLP